MKVSDTILALQALLLIPETKRVAKVGPLTRSAINRLASLPPDAEFDLNYHTLSTSPLAPAEGSEISQDAIDLILESEGVDQPYRWPGGESGITLGFGCDIGADPTSLDYWREELTPEELDTLSQAKGVTGDRARSMQTMFSGIKITPSQALRVFYRYTLPVEIAKTKAAFPGAEQLPPSALGALVSVVFNRGTSRKGARRVDMQDIYDILRDGVQTGDLALLAQQFRDMKHLWEGTGLDGLITRREREAKLVESCIVV